MMTPVRVDQTGRISGLLLVASGIEAVNNRMLVSGTSTWGVQDPSLALSSAKSVSASILGAERRRHLLQDKPHRL